MASLLLTMEPGGPERVSSFFPLLRQGFTVRAVVGCSIRELLCEQFHIDPDYLRQRVTTIFLNSKAVDDLESRVAHRATLALSAAMPGLVGATMRRGGFYAAMRGAMTHCEGAAESDGNAGEIRIKLFNLLMAELGPIFLKRGIVLSSSDAAEFLADLPSDFWDEGIEVLLNGRPAEPGFLKTGEWVSGEEPLELSVIFKE